MPDVFEKRIRRADALAREWPFASDLLAFYRAIAGFQQGVVRDPRPQEALLRDLLELVRRGGPPVLAAAAADLAGRTPAEREGLLGEFHGGTLPTETPLPVILLLQLVLQPIAMLEEPKTPQDGGWDPGDNPADCPRCGRAPVVGLLREDKTAETVRRSLVCSFCFLEWSFARILCPCCREERPEKLPRYAAQEIPWMRVEACDSCKKYIKSVDLTLNWEAEPIVDELASTPLDVIAHEHGYVKIAPNLAGI